MSQEQSSPTGATRLDRRGLLIAGLAGLAWPGLSSAAGASLPRVIVSSDIGGSDPDDFQSMVHLLLYGDRLDLEGLVSSPWGEGRATDILAVIDLYARDYANLKTWSARYPTPQALRAIVKQGELESAPYQGFRASTEGSRWIVRCARRPDPRPLHLLVWGGIEDLAQALYDAPDIVPKLRVFFIGGPNKKFSPDAYQYIAQHHPKLWIIESNDTYRGWFNGGDQGGEWGNTSFVSSHVAGRGALGDFFATKLSGTIKMGDTPSLGWVLSGHMSDPGKPGWGGRYVRAWSRAPSTYARLTSAEDRMEQFGILELNLPPVPAAAKADPAPGPSAAVLRIENQTLQGSIGPDGRLRFRSSPKDAKTYSYQVEGGGPGFDGQKGHVTSVRPAADADRHPASQWPNWWTDTPAPDQMEGVFLGAKTVSQWRRAYLKDFALRMDRCAKPAPRR